MNDAARPTVLPVPAPARAPGLAAVGRLQRRVRGAALYAGLVAGGLVSVFPLVWMVSTSLKMRGLEFTFPPELIPDPVAWSNYLEIWSMARYDLYVRNSFAVTLLATAGTVLSASLVAEVARFYERQAGKGLIDLRLGVAAGRDDVLALRPDVVVVATGSRPVRADVPGIAPERLFTVEDVLSGRADGARTALVVDRDGHAPALVAADHLSGRGARVDFVAAMEQVALHLGAEGGAVYEQLRQRGVSFAAGLDLVGGRDGRLVLRDLYDLAEEERPAADAVVVAAGGAPRSDLAGELAGLVPSVHVIGAAAGGRFIVDATVDGARVGRRV